MKRIKTKIKKFLGIDFTCRKSLYSELTNCYDNLEAQYKYSDSLKEKNKTLEDENKELRDEIMNKDRMIWDYEDTIHRLNSIIDDLTCADDDNQSY
jgi:cell division protein FtsB